MSVAAAWAAEELEALARKGLRRRLEPLSSPQDVVVRVEGVRLTNFSSNDYLGLANDGRLVRAASQALRTLGMGAGASRLVVGDSPAHRSLEARLSRFEGTEAALLFNSGYAANTGIIPVLVGEGDAVFSDALNHASIVDGCRLSRARRVVYPHADASALRRLLRETPARRKLVVTDAIFSMDGDRAPLPELAQVCREEGAALMVDEAHATGVLGARGAGLCEQAGVAGAVDVRMGTLGKALGVYGAYAATSGALAELLFNRARSLVFSTALPAAVCAAAEASVDIVEGEPELRERLWGNIRRFAAGLRELGLPAEARSAIFPVVLGSPEKAVSAALLLRERGLLVRPIRPPTVPEGTSRLRFALCATHAPEHLEQALLALKEVLRVR
ncbi:MAG TPA: 8-amino-7-oxononanoate synthase [Myxococcaceae bacterium]|nr:8-amino-7-oxononanoate synthase [Myxococcaceae bacterium]